MANHCPWCSPKSVDKHIHRFCRVAAGSRERRLLYVSSLLPRRTRRTSEDSAVTDKDSTYSAVKRAVATRPARATSVTQRRCRSEWMVGHP